MQFRSKTAVCLAAGLAMTAFAATALPTSPAFKILDRIPGPDGGWDYASIDAAHNRVLVSRTNAVMAVDLATRAVTPVLAPASRGHASLAVNGGRELLVTNGSTDSAVFVDAASGATLATVATGKNPDAASIDPKSGLILVMDHGGGDVVLIDPETHKSVGSIMIGGDLEAAVADGAGRAYVNVEDKNQIVVIDIAARKVVTRYALAGCDGPTGIAYAGAEKLLIAACDGAVEVVAADTGKVRQTLKIGKGADGVAYDDKRKLAFVPAGRDGTLAVFAMRAGALVPVQTLTTQKGARTIALDERTGRVYLPSGEYVMAAGAARPTVVPGTFNLIVVGK